MNVSRTILTSAWLCCAVAPLARGDRLETAPWNNGASEDGASIFVDLTATSGDIVITAIGMTNVRLPNTPVRLRVWRRSGSYVGFDGSADGWAPVEEVNGQVPRDGQPTSFVLTTPIRLADEETSGLLFEAEIGGLYYTGTPSEPPQTLWTDENLTLFSDVARNAPPFSGRRLSPRCFSGYIEYSEAVSLSVSGECPGPVTFDVSGATPGGLVALGYARGAGEQPIPPGRPCAGVVLGLNHTAQLLGARAADNNGAASFSTEAPSAACGRVFVQAIDIESCATTNVEEL